MFVWRPGHEVGTTVTLLFRCCKVHCEMVCRMLLQTICLPDVCPQRPCRWRRDRRDSLVQRRVLCVQPEPSNYVCCGYGWLCVRRNRECPNRAKFRTGACQVLAPGDVVVAVNGAPCIGLAPVDLQGQVRRVRARSYGHGILCSGGVCMAYNMFTAVCLVTQIRSLCTTVLVARIFGAASTHQAAAGDVVVKFRRRAEGATPLQLLAVPPAPFRLQDVALDSTTMDSRAAEMCTSCGGIALRGTGRLCASCYAKPKPLVGVARLVFFASR